MPIVHLQKVKDKKLRAKLQRQEEQIREASESAARAELLLQEEAGFLEAEGVEKTYNYRQDQLSKEVDINTSKKVNKEPVYVCMDQVLSYKWSVL